MSWCSDFRHQYRHMPLAVFLCLLYTGCMIAFTLTFYDTGFSGFIGALAPFIAVWVALGVGIFMCILCFIMVDCHVPKEWVQIKTVEEFIANVSSVQLPNHYSYYGPTPNLRKYTHHLIISDFELVYEVGPNGQRKAIDAKLYCKEYIDSYFPRLWYKTPRAVCCCNMKRCCCFGWVGAGQIQRREYLASALLKARGIIMNVRGNGDMEHSTVVDRLRRLEQRNGEPFWDLMLNNCEHYANWIMTGEHYAVQIATGPFWELYFLNSVGRVLLGTMQSAIITCLFRVAFIILFIWANAVHYDHTKMVYWIIIYIITAYNFSMVITDIAKVTHLKRCFGNGRFCYPCYSDYADNKPSSKPLIASSKHTSIREVHVMPRNDTVRPIGWQPNGNSNGKSSVDKNHTYPIVEEVWPHEGLKLNSRYSMPIVPCMFKSLYLFVMSTAALFGGSWLGQGPTVRDKIFHNTNCLPISELIMCTVTSLTVYVFWYPLMASSLDFFLWHKPRTIFGVIIYLLFAAVLIFWVTLIVQAGIKIGNSENMLEAAGQNASCWST